MPNHHNSREPGPHAVNEEGVFMEDMIMEHHIGRPLKPNEPVKHRNHDTLDNRDQNLYLTVDGIELDPGTVR